jgi:primosomal protein N' (replication factor Y)
MVLLTASGIEEGAVLRCCIRLRQSLESALTQMGQPWQLLGPAPASVVRVNNRYRYRLTLVGRADKRVRALIAYLLRAVHQDKENRGVSVYADVNPYNS